MDSFLSLYLASIFLLSYCILCIYTQHLHLLVMYVVVELFHFCIDYKHLDKHIDEIANRLIIVVPVSNVDANLIFLCFHNFMCLMIDNH